MKKGKAVKPDFIPVEAYEALDKRGTKKLTIVLNSIYEIENILRTCLFPHSSHFPRNLKQSVEIDTELLAS